MSSPRTIRLHARNLARASRGANMVEYIILVGVIALIALLAFNQFGDAVKEKITNQKNTVSQINDEKGK